MPSEGKRPLVRAEVSSFLHTVLCPCPGQVWRWVLRKPREKEWPQQQPYIVCGDGKVLTFFVSAEWADFRER